MNPLLCPPKHITETQSPHSRATVVSAGLLMLTAGVVSLQGYAVKAGMLCSRGELLLMADADGATVAAEAQRLEEALQKVSQPVNFQFYANKLHVWLPMPGNTHAILPERIRRLLINIPPL